MGHNSSRTLYAQKIVRSFHAHYDQLFYIYRTFDVKDKSNKEEAAKIFSVPDFIGDACKAIASRVRGAVAGVRFDDFHKVSSCNLAILHLAQV